MNDSNLESLISRYICCDVDHKPIPITAFDFIGGTAIIRRVFVFKKDINIERFESAVKEVVKSYPLFCGKIVREGYSFPEIACCDKGLVFVEQEHYAALEEICTSNYVQKNVDLFARTINDGVFLENMSLPLMKIVITRINPVGTVIGIVNPHIVADGRSIFHFLNAVSNQMADKALIVPSLEREYLSQLSKKAAVKVFSNSGRRQAKAKPSVIKKYTDRIKDLFGRYLYNTNYSDKTLEIEKEYIAKLKSEISEAAMPSVLLRSTQDVLCGYVLNLIISSLRRSNKPRHVTYEFLFDFTNLEGIPLDGNYIGNGFMPIRNRIDPECVRSSGTSDFAGMIRESIGTATKELLEDFPEELIRRRLGGGSLIHRRTNGPQAVPEEVIMCSNWSKFPAYELDFGAGKAALFDIPIYKTRSIDRMFVVLPNDKDSPYWRVRIHLPKQEMSKLERIRLSFEGNNRCL
jgi:hypothetical protein